MYIIEYKDDFEDGRSSRAGESAHEVDTNRTNKGAVLSDCITNNLSLRCRVHLGHSYGIHIFLESLVAHNKSMPCLLTQFKE